MTPHSLQAEAAANGAGVLRRRQIREYRHQVEDRENHGTANSDAMSTEAPPHQTPPRRDGERGVGEVRIISSDVGR